MSESGTGLNVSFTYRNIAHVEALKEGQTEDDFRAEVIERYRRLDAKRDEVSPEDAIAEAIQSVAEVSPPYPLTFILDGVPYRQETAEDDPKEIVEAQKAAAKPQPKRPQPDMPAAKPVEEPDTAEPQVKLEQDFRVIAAKGIGWFNVVDGAGVPANPKALRKPIAEELAKQMNKPGNPPKQDEGV